MEEPPLAGVFSEIDGESYWEWVRGVAWGGGTLLMRAALPALDAAAALIDPDGYLWMFGGNNGPGTVLHTRRHAAWANALALPHSSCVQLCLL